MASRVSIEGGVKQTVSAAFRDRVDALLTKPDAKKLALYVNQQPLRVVPVSPFANVAFCKRSLKGMMTPFFTALTR